ncbi:MAG: glycosyltransferase family 2 protein [Bacteroidales bacterium]|nr:glycosyltransferase family 2 protein [Bacteroidales bacterium]
MDDKSKAPFVSVIVPNYNHARYLPERINSILAQTYQNFEIILLDDHSSDNSVDILNGYINDPHVSSVIINENNSGSTFIQWETGIRLAKGEIIWIAESDDSCEPVFLESLVHVFMETADCAIAYCASLWIDEDGNPINTPKKYNEDYVFSGIDFIKQRLAIGTHIWNASSAIFRKSVYETIPRDYMTFRNTGDHLFWLELARSKGANVVFLHQQMNYFRKHGNNVSAQQDRFLNIYSEERRIFDIQVRYGFIRGLKKYHVSDCYRTMILSRGFANEDDRLKALDTWKEKKFYQWAPKKILSKLYCLVYKSCL